MALGKGLAELFLVLGRQVFKPIDIVGFVQVVLDVFELLRRHAAMVTPDETAFAFWVREKPGSREQVSPHK